MGQKINLHWVQFKNSRIYTGCDYIMRIGHCMTMFPVLKQNHDTQKFANCKNCDNAR